MARSARQVCPRISPGPYAPTSGPGGFSAYVAEALEQRVAMDKLREIVIGFGTGNEELTREEIEAARALLRHDHRHTGGAAT